MKINPAGIQSYQQVTTNNRSQNAGMIKKDQQLTEATLSIAPQEETFGSKVGVRATGVGYGEMLTADEKKALDLLFNRFKDSSRFGAGYLGNEANASGNSPLGNMVDVKV